MPLPWVRTTSLVLGPRSSGKTVVPRQSLSAVEASANTARCLGRDEGGRRRGGRQRSPGLASELRLLRPGGACLPCSCCPFKNRGAMLLPNPSVTTRRPVCQLRKHSKSFSVPSVLLLHVVGPLQDSGTSGLGGWGSCHYVLPRVGPQATSKTQKSWFLTQRSLPTPHSFLWPWIFHPEMRIV